jgi:succinate dehydrogenase / fumarate reductase membrane anchor subunit
MSMRSPLSRVLGLGAAGDGPAHWWAQRVSAVGTGLLAIWFAMALIGLDLGDRGAVVEWAARPLNSVLLILLVATMSYHSSLGVQVVIEDYSRGWSKVTGLVAAQFVHAVLAGVGIVAILRMALGS